MKKKEEDIIKETLIDLGAPVSEMDKIMQTPEQ